jgi:hypothetical protein
VKREGRSEERVFRSISVQKKIKTSAYGEFKVLIRQIIGVPPSMTR